MILVCGHDELALLTLKTLQQFGQQIVVIAPVQIPNLPTAVVFILGSENDPDTLHKAQINQGKAIILLKNDDQNNFKAALLIREINPKIRVVSRLYNQNLGRYFDSHIPYHFSLSIAALVAPAFALKAVSDDFLGYFALPICSEVPSQSQPRQPDEVNPEKTSLWNVVDLTIKTGSRLVRLSLTELEEQFQARVLFHYPVDQLADFSTDRLFDDFDARAPLAQGDRVVLICPPHYYVQLLQRNGEGISRAQRWAAGQTMPMTPSRWQWKTLALNIKQGFKQTSSLTRFLMATLGSLLALGTVNFLSLGKSISDAIFLTVTVLTGGYSDIDEFKDPQTSFLVKLIAIFLTLVGAALVGLVYGIVTDKLLSSRIGLGKAAVIPKAGHVILAGLGHVGFRIIQLLKQMGYEVVAIEQNADNPFVGRARQEEIAVVIGDSANPSVLKQVNSSTGRSLICATDRDLANLETALTGVEGNPKLRTVLRLLDASLSTRLHQYFHHLNTSYQLASLAAPAFATAALVGSVYGTMIWEDQTLLVTVVTVSARSPLLNRSLTAIIQEYDLLPLLIQPLDQTTIVFPRWREPHMDRRLTQGDRLYVLATPMALSRLAQRRPLPTEAYRVQVVSLHNAYFTQDIVDAIAFYSRQSPENIRDRLTHLPAIVSPQLSRERALKLARHLRKMNTEVTVIAEIAQSTADPHGSIPST